MGLVLAVACVQAALPGAASGAAPANSPTPPLPDSVLFALPWKSVSVREAQALWARLPIPSRPEGKGDQLKRGFADQLIEKELLAHAALGEPFQMTTAETARYQALGLELARQRLYKDMVLDSVRIIPADEEAARKRGGPQLTPERLDMLARRAAEQRVGQEVSLRIQGSITAQWDDSTAAFLARSYAALPPLPPPQDNNPFAMSGRVRNPNLSAADSARVLATAPDGALTAGEFARRYAAISPFETNLPTTVEDVKKRALEFLAAMWFDAETVRRGYDRSPETLARLAERREAAALDHYYERHVASKIDTSRARVDAYYAANKDRYALGEHVIAYMMPAATRAEADSVADRLRGGEPWDTVLVKRWPDPDVGGRYHSYRVLMMSGPDSVLARRLLAVGEGSFTVLPADSGSGARSAGRVEENARWEVWKVDKHAPYQVRPLEEARPFARRDLIAEESELRLQQVLADLKKESPARVNSRGLARLDLGPDAPASASLP
jgi:hypothetical protein